MTIDAFERVFTFLNTADRDVDIVYRFLTQNTSEAPLRTPFRNRMEDLAGRIVTFFSEFNKKGFRANKATLETLVPTRLRLMYSAVELNFRDMIARHQDDLTQRAVTADKAALARKVATRVTHLRMSFGYLSRIHERATNTKLEMIRQLADTNPAQTELRAKLIKCRDANAALEDTFEKQKAMIERGVRWIEAHQGTEELERVASQLGKRSTTELQRQPRQRRRTKTTDTEEAGSAPQAEVEEYTPPTLDQLDGVVIDPNDPVNRTIDDLLTTAEESQHAVNGELQQFAHLATTIHDVDNTFSLSELGLAPLVPVPTFSRPQDGSTFDLALDTGQAPGAKPASLDKKAWDILRKSIPYLFWTTAMDGLSPVVTYYKLQYAKLKRRLYRTQRMNELLEVLYAALLNQPTLFAKSEPAYASAAEQNAAALDKLNDILKDMTPRDPHVDVAQEVAETRKISANDDDTNMSGFVYRRYNIGWKGAYRKYVSDMLEFYDDADGVRHWFIAALPLTPRQFLNSSLNKGPYPDEPSTPPTPPTPSTPTSTASGNRAALKDFYTNPNDRQIVECVETMLDAETAALQKQSNLIPYAFDFDGRYPSHAIEDLLRV